MSRFIAVQASTTLSPQLTHWLDSAADGLDTGTIDPAILLPKLTAAGLAQVGVPLQFGGSGGNVTDAIAAIAAVSERSLAAGLGTEPISSIYSRVPMRGCVSRCCPRHSRDDSRGQQVSRTL
jgi:hypothetical protein